MEREKKIISGPLLEVDFFPVWADGRRMPSRAPKEKRSTAAQQKYNDTQMRKKAIRDINANFDSGDIFMCPTYEQSKAPQSYEEALRDSDNYLRRIKRRRENELKRINKLLASGNQDRRLLSAKKKLEAPFKYYYSIEEVKYKNSYIEKCVKDDLSQFLFNCYNSIPYRNSKNEIRNIPSSFTYSNF